MHGDLLRIRVKIMALQKINVLPESKLIEKLDYSWSEESIRYINTPSVQARNTFFYVQEVGSFETFYPYYTERANLNSYLIIYTSSGTGVLKYEDDQYQISPQSILFINCRRHHIYKCIKNENWNFLWLHFNGSTSEGYYNEFLKNGFHILHPADGNSIELIMTRILSLTVKKDVHSEILVSSLIVQLLTDILIENSSENLGLGTTPAYIKAALQYIDRYFAEDINLDSLASRLSISKYHLSRQFKKYVGTTINEYLIIARINHAKELLRHTSLTIEEISYQCGFHFPSYFVNAFRQRGNSTPGQYRSEWGEKSITKNPSSPYHCSL